MRTCKQCNTEKPIKEFIDRKTTRKICRDCIRENDRWRHLKKTYGVTKEEYLEMFYNQGGACWICSKTPEENGQSLAVDHCHDTGKVRGLLCSQCNLMLGYAEDNIGTLATAIKYLRK